MASVAVYSSRSRANDRVGRLRKEMDKHSGYTLSNLNESSQMGKYSSSSLSATSTIIPSSVTLSSTSSVVSRRPPRDSSIGALGRANRETSLTRVGSIRLKDSSLPRMKEVALPSLTSSAVQASSRVMPLDNGLGSETARYARENAIKEIHDNFMKSYKDTNDKINNRSVDEQGERRSKAYAKIMGTTAAINYISEEEVKKQCISEMFMETGRFSTKTLAAVTSLENFDSRRKKDYNWRKTMEEYESSGQMERDKRARNIASAVGRRETAETHRKREIQDTDDGDIWAVKKAPRKPDPEQEIKKPAPRTETQVRKVVQAAPKTEPRKPEAPKPAEPIPAPVEPRKSRLDNHPEKVLQRQQENRSEKEQLLQQLQQQRLEQQQRVLKQQKLEQEKLEEEQLRKKEEEPAEKAEEMKVDEAAVEQPASEVPKPATEEDEDGMKKMRKDFFANMSSLDEEFEAGRSKLAKLRERIRRAKGVIKEADAALQNSS